MMIGSGKMEIPKLRVELDDHKGRIPNKVFKSASPSAH